MFDDLDEALRQLLIRELPIKKGEVDVTFEQPKREWSARLSRPTLNFFLYDLRENIKLRQPSRHWVTESQDGTQAVRRRAPVRVELRYLITAWANEPADEHRLLARMLMAFFRTPTLPEDLLPESLRGQPGPIVLEVAQPDAMTNSADFWSAMDNEIRPIIPCTINLAIDPAQPVTVPVVRDRDLRFVDDNTGESEEPGRVLWVVQGTLRGRSPLRRVRMILVEQGLEVPVGSDGTYTIRGLASGEYTVGVQVADGQPSRHKLTVPADSYDIDLPNGNKP